MTSHHYPTRFIIIGLNNSPAPYLPPSIQTLIHEGEAFSRGLRHHDIISALLPEGAEWIDIAIPLDAVFACYETYDHIVIFASGGPLLFGFTNTIRRRLPETGIRLYPTFNSLQALAYRLVVPYDDMRTVSLTGRPWYEFDRALIERTPGVGILTDRKHTPAAIVRRILDCDCTHYTVYVGKHLGDPEWERIRRLELREAVELTFEYPSYLIVRQYPDTYIPTHPEARINLPLPGTPGEKFKLLDGRIRVITKAPIRLLTFSTLELNRHVSFWDVGSCTGSVSIEARLQFPHLHVTSFEIRPGGQRLMEVNNRRFDTPGITILIGDFPETDLDTISRPDTVFIGGHGGRLREIIACISHYLLPGGCIAFNSVSGESESLFIEGVREAGLRLLSGTKIAVNGYNPIEILKAEQQ